MPLSGLDVIDRHQVVAFDSIDNLYVSTINATATLYPVGGALLLDTDVNANSLAEIVGRNPFPINKNAEVKIRANFYTLQNQSLKIGLGGANCFGVEFKHTNATGLTQSSLFYSSTVDSIPAGQQSTFQSVSFLNKIQTVRILFNYSGRTVEAWLDSAYLGKFKPSTNPHSSTDFEGIHARLLANSAAPNSDAAAMYFYSYDVKVYK